MFIGLEFSQFGWALWNVRGIAVWIIQALSLLVTHSISIVLLSGRLVMVLFVALVVWELSNLWNYVVWAILVVALLLTSDFGRDWVIITVVMHHSWWSRRSNSLESSTTSSENQSSIISPCSYSTSDLLIYFMLLHCFLINWKLMASSSLLRVIQWSREFIILVLFYTSILV